ncbi:hypothetical protein EXIGLDRAFT_241070 [Exidia glandulosa HHB12029]|uniref:Uncharacterized protein n=1 Tax=Exidia glandulosa HHB12029 TaxID=1314781 RepID=A0A165Q6S1_EXIGL|nr:hypothetical protein EXIGLDRAFT_241070 [Exidia glandulosa HHB12029]
MRDGARFPPRLSLSFPPPAALMRTLPLVLLCVLGRIAGILGQSVSIGNDNWGLELALTTPPRACQPLRMYYNIGPVSDPPDFVKYPDTAVVQFLTPDSSETEWMTWHPPNGQGVFSWTVPLPAGKQFVVKNFQGYKQVFTVASGSSGCGETATNVTSSFAYGSLNTGVFQTLKTKSYSSYSVTPDSQFHGVDMPSSANVVTVPLGADRSPPATSTPPSTSNGSTPDKGNDGSTSDKPVPNVTTSPGTSDQPQGQNPGSSTGTSNGASSVTGTNAVSPTSSPHTTTLGASSAADNSSPSSPAAANGDPAGAPSSGNSGPTSLPAATETVTTTSHDTNVAAIVGGLLGALAVGVGIGAFIVWLHRRRRRRARMAEIVSIPPMRSETPKTIATAATSDRKRPLFVPPPTDSDYGSDTFAGLSEYPISVAPDDERQAPPTYSRFA